MNSGPGERNKRAESAAFSLWLDFFRWVAAFAVVLDHVNNRMFVKILTLPPQDRTIEHYIFALLSGFGRPAVIIFFVLSGTLVGGYSLAEYRQTGAFSARNYFTARFSRLWTVLIPAFFVIAGLNYLGAHTFQGVTLNIYSTLPNGNLDKLDVGTFVCNSFFLQNALCASWGDDNALWSLFNEFWYYITWPMIMLAAFSNYKSSIRMAMGVFALLLVSVLTHLQTDKNNNLFFYYFVWLAGVFVPHVRIKISYARTVASVVIFFASLLSWRAFLPSKLAEENFMIQFSTDMALALLFANMLVHLRGAQELVAPPFGSIHKFLAGFSFSLYCLHTPIVNFCSSVLMKFFSLGWKMIPGHHWRLYLLALSVAAFAVAVSFVFSRVTEAHTHKVREFLRNLWPSKATSPAVRQQH